MWPMATARLVERSQKRCSCGLLTFSVVRTR
jgi:hypothetical protein